MKVATNGRVATNGGRVATNGVSTLFCGLTTDTSLLAIDYTRLLLVNVTGYTLLAQHLHMLHVGK